MDGLQEDILLITIMVSGVTLHYGRDGDRGCDMMLETAFGAHYRRSSYRSRLLKSFSSLFSFTRLDFIIYTIIHLPADNCLVWEYADRFLPTQPLFFAQMRKEFAELHRHEGEELFKNNEIPLARYV